ncbi:MAG TPA: hypothetical protein VFS43_30845 [Polyangiaceae bacterium]|nr:hypothetical protein [Polyangiaceae bacterium]
MSLLLVALAASACCRGETKTLAAPEPAGSPAAAAPGAASGPGASGGPEAPAPAASGSAAPASPPVASWQDPRVIEGLAERCDFEPDRLGGDGQKRHFGHVFEDDETISCEGPPVEQSCSYDPCRPGEGETPCQRGCKATCGRCAAGCVATCGGCRQRCKGDRACERQCAEATASCRQGCFSRRDSCLTADCAEAEKKCNERFRAAWAKNDCTDRLANVYAPCAESCRSQTGGDGSGCVRRCQAKVAPCDPMIMEMGDWGSYAPYGSDWKKNGCDAKCEAYRACAAPCGPQGWACRHRCAEPLRPCPEAGCGAP